MRSCGTRLSPPSKGVSLIRSLYAETEITLEFLLHIRHLHKKRSRRETGKTMSDVLMLALVVAAFAAAAAYAGLCTHSLGVVATCRTRTTDDLVRLAANRSVHGPHCGAGAAARRLHDACLCRRADRVWAFVRSGRAEHLSVRRDRCSGRAEMVRVCAGAARVQRRRGDCALRPAAAAG